MKKESEKKALVALLFINCMAALEVQSNLPQATTSKCEELVVAYARWSLTRGGRLREPYCTRSLKRRSVDKPTFWRESFACSFFVLA